MLANSTTKPLYYKGEDTFKRNLAVGFVGEVYAAKYMERCGHQFEFSGYGAGTIDVFDDVSKKRKRTPDLVCAHCGQKIEVRAKTRLQVSMSDSPSRPFDRDMAPHDWVSFVRVIKRAGATDDHDPESYEALGRVYTFIGQTLMDSRSLALLPRRKGAKDAYESYLSWPVVNAGIGGVVQKIDRKNRRIIIEGQQLSYLKIPQGYYLYGYLSEGDWVEAGDLIAGILPPVPRRGVVCPNSPALN